MLSRNDGEYCELQDYRGEGTCVWIDGASAGHREGYYGYL